MKSLLMTCMVAALPFAAAACGSKGADKANALNIVGTWMGDDCREQAVFTATELTFSAAEYKEPGCIEAAKTTTVSMRGTYVTGESAASQTDVDGATALDLTLATVTLTVHDQVAVDQYGATEVCGVVVKKDVPIELSAAACGDANPAGAFEKGKVWYNVFRATESELHFGKDGGATPDQRPLELEAVPMKKKA